MKKIVLLISLLSLPHHNAMASEHDDQATYYMGMTAMQWTYFCVGAPIIAAFVSKYGSQVIKKAREFMTPPAPVKPIQPAPVTTTMDKNEIDELYQWARSLPQVTPKKAERPSPDDNFSVVGVIHVESATKLNHWATQQTMGKGLLLGVYEPFPNTAHVYRIPFGEADALSILDTFSDASRLYLIENRDPADDSPEIFTASFLQKIKEKPTLTLKYFQTVNSDTMLRVNVSDGTIAIDDVVAE